MNTYFLSTIRHIQACTHTHIHKTARMKPQPILAYLMTTMTKSNTIKPVQNVHHQTTFFTPHDLTYRPLVTFPNPQSFVEHRHCLPLTQRPWPWVLKVPISLRPDAETIAMSEECGAPHPVRDWNQTCPLAVYVYTTSPRVYFIGGKPVWLGCSLLRV